MMVVEGGEMSSGQMLRRNLPGTRSADFYNWPDQSFDEMDSTLAVQQYIQQTIRADYTDIEDILTSPEGQDEGVWKYEHLRQFCLELNGLAVKLQNECTAETCSQMTATEQWIFLCAAHKTPKECPAIDYTRHTLDGAACLLNSNKYFPSRVSIKDSSVAKLGSVCRRVYRIFSHAYYHHRHIFDEFENESHLCRRFTVFVIKYNLMSRDNLIVPILEEPALKTVKGTIPVFTLASPTQEQMSGQPSSSQALVVVGSSNSTRPRNPCGAPKSEVEESGTAPEESQEDESIPSESDNLSTTIILASEHTEEEQLPSSQEEGFGNSGGTPDFATLRISKSTSKTEPEDNVEEDSSTPEADTKDIGACGDSAGLNEAKAAESEA